MIIKRYELLCRVSHTNIFKFVPLITVEGGSRRTSIGQGQGGIYKLPLQIILLQLGSDCNLRVRLFN